MKKSTLIVLFLAFASQIFAQKAMSELSVIYTITAVKVKGGGKNAMAGKAMENSSISITSKNSQSKMTMDMMNGMMKMQMFTNKKTNSSNMFMSMMGQNIEMIGMDSIQKAQKAQVDTVKIKAAKPVATGKKKKILDYDCDEYVTTSVTKGKKSTTLVYITKAIKADKSIFENSEQMQLLPSMAGSEGMDGFPLEMTIETDEMQMTMEATSVEDEVEDKEFIMPTGYKKVNAKDMAKMKGGF
jgi:hypothetical protein